MNEITKNSIDNYVNHKLEPGSFVKAVLANDLVGAFSYADQDNVSSLRETVLYMYNHIPSNVWGSYEKVKSHLNRN
jgi:hypothetical protein